MTTDDLEKSIASLQRSMESAWQSTERQFKESWEAILKLHDQLAWKLSLETSGADQRLVAFQKLETVNANLDRLVNSFDRLADRTTLLLQQREETAAAAELREREWAHRQGVLLKEWGDQRHQDVKAVHEELARIKQALEIKKQLDDLAKQDKKTADDASKLAKEAGGVAEDATKTANETDGVLKAINNLSRRVEDLSGSQATHKADDDEPSRRDPWYSRLVASVFKGFFSAPLRGQVMFAIILILLGLLGAMGIVLRDAVEQRQRDAREREAPPVHALPAKP